MFSIVGPCDPAGALCSWIAFATARRPSVPRVLTITKPRYSRYDPKLSAAFAVQAIAVQLTIIAICIGSVCVLLVRPGADANRRRVVKISDSTSAIHVDLAVRNRAQVALPNGPAGFGVGWPDRDHVVEPAMAQQCGIEGSYRVRRADEQPVLALPERRYAV